MQKLVPGEMLSLREIERRWGIGRVLLSAEIEAGNLTGEKVGVAFIIKSENLQPWMRRYLLKLKKAVDS